MYSECESNSDPKWRIVGQEFGIADQYHHPKPAAVDDRAAEELTGVQEQLVVQETPRGPGDSVLAPPSPSTARHGGAGASETPIVSYPSRVDPCQPQPSSHEPMDTDVRQDGSAPQDLEMIGTPSNSVGPPPFPGLPLPFPFEVPLSAPTYDQSASASSSSVDSCPSYP